MDRLSTTDAAFYFAETENTPMHVGAVSIFDGPAPSYGDLIRLLLGMLHTVPRYRQRVKQTPLSVGRPLWVDDEHFQIRYHVRHTAVPRPGSHYQLRNLAGRVLGQRLDLTKPLWELWLVEGLADDQWAVIHKVHHAMVDGVAGTDLMHLTFDTDPHAPVSPAQDWTPSPPLSPAAVVATTVRDGVTASLGALRGPAAHLAGLARHPRAALALPGAAARTATALSQSALLTARQAISPAATELNGPVGPHRRWAWGQGSVDDVHLHLPGPDQLRGQRGLRRGAGRRGAGQRHHPGHGRTPGRRPPREAASPQDDGPEEGGQPLSL